MLLQGYNYFIIGFVQDIGHALLDSKSVVLGKVKHSQRMNDSCLNPWLVIERDVQLLMHIVIAWLV